MGDRCVFLRAEDQADRRAFMPMRPIFTRVVEIQVHLAGIGMSKFTEFQIHNDEASKSAVEENQINPIPFGAYAQSLLSSDECKIVAQLQEELLKAPYECVFEFRFRILVLQIQEFEDERISHVSVG